MPDAIQALRHYAHALAQVQPRPSPAPASPPADPTAVLKVFLARDRVQTALNTEHTLPDESLVWLVQLDEQLQPMAAAIAHHPAREQWRKSLQPPDHYWWWHVTPKEPWNRWDWLWNGGSLICLAAFASYMTAFTAKFAVGGFDLLKSFGFVGNGTVAVLILSSLTQSGQKALSKLLTRLKIHPKYHSEVSFGASALLLLSAVTIQASLPQIGQYYYRQGAENFSNRRFTPAEKQLRQSLELQAGNGDAHLLLGRIYEIQENLEAARAEYNLALQGNSVLAYNNLGRLLIADENYRQAEALLTKGLSYAQQSAPDAHETLFVLHKNLGWAQLEQDRYESASANLERALQINQAHLDGRRSGEADCMLSAVFERLNDTDAAIASAETCLEQGAFETALDHEWFIDAQRRLMRLQEPALAPGGGSNLPVAPSVAPNGNVSPGGNR
ncbi:MAG: tetratricopeptide repeat protein [Leptolyngbyaceae cyanobacterium]